MKFYRVAAALSGALVMHAAPAQAQEAAVPATPVAEAAATAEPAATPAVPVAAAMPVAAALTLPSYTDIVLTPDSEASSKKLREGHVVPMHTLFDVMHNGAVVIPKGTRGQGTVTWRTGKGAFGKSAKMEITFNELTLASGQKLALSGMHRQEGEGNTGAAVGAAVAVGVFGAFVTGRSAIIPVGQHLTARTAETLTYSIPAGAKIIPTATIEPAAPVAAAEAAPAVEPAPAAQPVTE